MASETDTHADKTPTRHPLNYRLSMVLFLLTCLSTFFAGVIQSNHVSSFMAFYKADWTSGYVYSAAVMTILLFHEFGHFLQAVRHKVPASLPWFIPVPFTPPGTMGAVLAQVGVRKDGVLAASADRRQMFDIAVTGPLAGLAITFPILWFGAAGSQYVEVDAAQLVLGEPFVLQWIAEQQLGPCPENHELLLTPLLFAGWVGLLVTALNLFPVGLLDGGRILYSLIGRRANLVAIAVLVLAMMYSLLSANYSYLIPLGIITLFMRSHPPTLDDTVKPGIFRMILGWLTLSFIFLGFTPEPFTFLEPESSELDLENNAVIPLGADRTVQDSWLLVNFCESSDIVMEHQSVDCQNSGLNATFCVILKPRLRLSRESDHGTDGAFHDDRRCNPTLAEACVFTLPRGSGAGLLA